VQGDEKQKQDRSLEDTKENVGRTEEQGSFEEKERKSYGRKGKSPFLLFFVLLPILLSAAFVYGLYRYGQKIIADRNQYNGETVAEVKEEGKAEEQYSPAITKLKTKGELNLLFLGNDFLKGEEAFFSSLKTDLEESYGGKVEWRIPELPGNATALSAYLKLQEEELSGDVIILSFSDYDNPYTFPYYYELLLRECIRRFPEGKILCLIGDRAFVQEKHTKDNAFVVKNIAEHYGIDVLNLASILAKKQTEPVAFLNNKEEYSSFAKSIYKIAFREAIEKTEDRETTGSDNTDRGNTGSETISLQAPLNSILEQEAFCIIALKEEFQELGDTALVLSKEKLDSLGISGKSGILAQALSLNPGSNQGNCLVDGLLMGSYTLEGNSYLGIYTKELIPRNQILLLFASKEEREQFHSLFFLKGVPLEKGLENGTALPVPEIPVEETATGESLVETVTETNTETAAPETTAAQKKEEKPAVKQEETKQVEKEAESSSEEFIISDQGPGDVR
jgi:hypothetical protein